MFQDGPFCVFPTDFSIGDGETAFINVEYLPSAVGPHEARFVMVQVRPKLNRCHNELPSCPASRDDTVLPSSRSTNRTDIEGLNDINIV